MSLTEDKKILVTEKVYFLLTFIHKSFLKGKLRRYGAFPNTDMLFVDIDNKLNSNFILFLMSPF